MSVMVKNLTLVGCGQVGTSILLAMAQQNKPLPTTIYDANPETEALLRAKFKTEGFDSSHLTFTSSIAEAVPKADLIILATPMSKFEEAAREVAQHAKLDAILTDTGSAKKVSIENIRRAIDGEMHIHYVPAHPGNGSQGAGPNTASAGNILGRNSTMFLISEKGESYNPPAYYPEGVVQNFWKDIGVTTAFITTEKHNNFFGQCSHFQHALVFSLMNLAKDNPQMLHNFQHAGTALRNMSRVAISQLQEGKPSALIQMWEPIFEQNKGPISEAYTRFQKHLDEFVELVESGKFNVLSKKLKAAKAYRDSFDDPERREIITGEINDLRDVPKFDANQKGALEDKFNAKSTSALSSNLLLPLAISYAQLMSAHEIDPTFIAWKANPSFRDGTHPSTYSVEYVADLLKAKSIEFAELAKNLQQQLKQVMSAINQNDAGYVHDAILSAQIIRNSMPSPRKGDAVREGYERIMTPE